MEQSNPVRNALGRSEFSPPKRTDEDLVSTLKRQYVEGEIDEDEFERKVDRLTATESLDEIHASRMHEPQNTNREWRIHQ